MTLLDSYNYIFSNKEMEKLKELDKQNKRLEKLIEKKSDQIEKLEKEFDRLYAKNSACFSKADKILEKLQKRCKHNNEKIIRFPLGDEVYCVNCGKMENNI